MSRGERIGLALVLAAVVAGSVVLVLRAAPLGPSVRSPGPFGWLAAERYLEARSTWPTLLDRPLAEAKAKGVLVVAFPWQRLGGPQDGFELRRCLAEGATVLLAYSGSSPDFSEEDVFDSLGVPLHSVGGYAPLLPWRWHAWAEAEWSLQADPASLSTAPPIVVRALRSVPAAPAEARVLYRGDGGVPAIFIVARGKGTLVVLPAEALANCRLGSAGSADLLESLRAWFGDVWVFDEFHHGLVAHGGSGSSDVGGVMLVLLAHLGLAYALAVVALSRRFGPAWLEATPSGGSTLSFLRALGALHHRLGHHREAARLLLARLRELDPRLVVPEDLEQRVSEADARSFLPLVRAIARLQMKKRSSP